MSNSNRYKKINLRTLYPELYPASAPEIELPEEQADLILVAVAEYDGNEDKHAKRLARGVLGIDTDHSQIHNLLQTEKQVEAIVEERIAVEKMKKQFSALSPKQRRRFLLYANGYTDREIAKTEKVSHQNVAKSIAAARLKLRLKSSFK